MCCVLVRNILLCLHVLLFYSLYRHRLSMLIHVSLLLLLHNLVHEYGFIDSFRSIKAWSTFAIPLNFVLCA